jgi:hypothetical protein
MRLLNTSTLELCEFQGRIPDYAILSHTWETEEVLYNDIYRPEKKQMAGYKKIERCCSQAAYDGYGYVWVDTCCIDKSSSSELSEAINTMYHWYQNAKVCYVYLADVPSRGNDGFENAFNESRWFTRGWTLQELLAPPVVLFFDKHWIKIGTKFNLQHIISTATGIPANVLVGDVQLDSVSVGQRMSWASKRKTTRAEDMAYSLMGVFGVNMPMMYGEGNKAFIRLQLEILKISDDHSMFAWTWEHGYMIGRGLLAHDPSEFSDCGNIIKLPMHDVAPSSMTNRGLCIELPLILVPGEKEHFLAIINCQVVNESGALAGGEALLAIKLEELPGGQMNRINSTQLDRVEIADKRKRERRVIYIREELLTRNPLSSPPPLPLKEEGTFYIFFDFVYHMQNFSLVEVYPPGVWSTVGESALEMPGQGTMGRSMTTSAGRPEKTPLQLIIQSSGWAAAKFESDTESFVVRLKNLDYAPTYEIFNNTGTSTAAQIYRGKIPRSVQIGKALQQRKWLFVAIRQEFGDWKRLE